MIVAQTVNQQGQQISFSTFGEAPALVGVGQK
jgi:hypothetical protein